MTSGDDAQRDSREPSATPSAPNEYSRGEDDVIRIEDLAPPENVHGGRKILLGEFLTPLSNPRIPSGS